MPLGQNNLQTIGQLSVLQLRKFYLGLESGHRELGSIHFGAEGRILRKRMDFQDVNTFGKPLVGDAPQIVGGGFTHRLERGFVIIGTATENLVHRQNVRFSTESADSFRTADESGEMLSFHPLQFLWSGTALQKSG